MMKVSIKRLASDVATILGEPLARDCHPEESPFPAIEDRVRLLAPAALAEISPHPSDLRPYPATGTDDTLQVRDSLYFKLAGHLAKMISQGQ